MPQIPGSGDSEALLCGKLSKVMKTLRLMVVEHRIYMWFTLFFWFGDLNHTLVCSCIL
jgi:hypothetical protein